MFKRYNEIESIIYPVRPRAYWATVWVMLCASVIGVSTVGCIGGADESSSTAQAVADGEDGPGAEVTSENDLSGDGSTADQSEPASDVGEDADSESQEPAPATKAKLVDYQGLMDTVKQSSGKIVVVDVWSTSCPPCMKEFPHLVELAAKYPEDLTCVSMNVDYIGSKRKPPESLLPRIQGFLDKNHANITNLVSTEPDEVIWDKLDVGAIPAILIYGPDGQLANKITDDNAGEDGLTYEGDVIPAIESLIADN